MLFYFSPDKYLKEIIFLNIPLLFLIFLQYSWLTWLFKFSVELLNKFPIKLATTYKSLALL